MVEQVIKSIPINQHKKGVTVLDVPSNLFIKKLADHFKEKNIIKLPAYSVLVKCSHSNELSPLDPDWFFHKAAAVARQIYITKSKTFGIGSLRSKFGKKHRRGREPSVTSRGSGKIIRDVVTQLRKSNYVENYASTDGTTLGLLMTKAGRGALDKIAASLKK